MEIKDAKTPSDSKLKEIVAEFTALPIPTKFHYDILSTFPFTTTEKAVGFRVSFSDGSKRAGMLWFPKSKMRRDVDGRYCIQTQVLNDIYGRRPELFFPEIAPGLRIISL